MMKKIYFLIILLNSFLAISQAGNPAAPYYNGSNWTLTGTALKNALATKITTTHTNLLTYTPGIWEASKITDLDPADATNTNVLLLYGFSSNMCPASPGDDNDHRRRNKDSNGGNNSCQWNREHVYAKSLGTPVLDDDATPSTGVSDAGEDAHHLRAADVQRNGARGNRRFADGSGNSGNVGADWYPGDEWKGDVARMMMYMYLRYGNQCLPTGVAKTGIATAATDSNMVQLFLEWNAEDPVSQYEDNRNTYHNSNGTYAQGNRNPFIDNPYLATVIWGGPVAENRWPTVLSNNEFDQLANVSVYPNPSSGEFQIQYDPSIGDLNVEVYSTLGQKVFERQNNNANTISVIGLQSGVYLVKINKDSKSVVKKVVIN